MPTVSELWVYPIKSCAGVSLSKAALEPAGLAHDRRWMVVNAESGRFITQREIKKIALVHAAVDSAGLHLSAPGQRDLTLPIETQSNARSVSVWSATPSALVEPPLAAEWFTRYLGVNAELVRVNEAEPRLQKPFYQRPGASDVVSFADFASLHLATTSSLARLNELTDNHIPMNRFRPNVVIDNDVPWQEDAWDVVSIGAVKLHVVRSADRCVITDTDQASAQRSSVVLKALAQARRGIDKSNDNGKSGLFFGTYASHEAAPGAELSLGQALEVGRLAETPNIRITSGEGYALGY